MNIWNKRPSEWKSYKLEILVQIGVTKYINECESWKVQISPSMGQRYSRCTLHRRNSDLWLPTGLSYTESHLLLHCSHQMSVSNMFHAWLYNLRCFLVLMLVIKFGGTVLTNILLSNHCRFYCRRPSSLVHISVRHYFGLIIAPVLVLLGTGLLSASIHHFGLIVIETTSRGCFIPAQNNYVSMFLIFF